ncbi:MAG: phosphoribosyltransferase [Candidatus Hecatellales archaeon B24]|nr:MAG: phosphoribosyltransferase [Candidatus Hecatellales archaeon B24]
MAYPSQSLPEIEYASKMLEALKGRVVWDNMLLGKYYVFRDRLHAGEILASLLQEEDLKGLVLAIPNGGIPVGVALTGKLRIGFDLAICRKLQIPWNKEAGFGALAPDGSLALNEKLMESLNLNSKVLEAQKRKALEELEEKERVFRGDRPPPHLKGEHVILVDDGLASGYTMLAAVRYAWRGGASKVVVAIPTGSVRALKLVAGEAWKVYCANVRGDLLGFAVADAYQQWYDVSDGEALEWLRRIRGWRS